MRLNNCSAVDDAQRLGKSTYKPAYAHAIVRPHLQHTASQNGFKRSLLARVADSVDVACVEVFTASSDGKM